MMRLINDDCRNAMKKLISEGVKVDLTVTSPPYDNLRTYDDSLEWNMDIFKEIADLLYEITSDGGVVVWIVNDATINGSETGTSFKQALYFKEIGFKLHDTMIYKKKGITFPEFNRYYPNFEYMFVLAKGKIKTYNLLKDRKNKTHGDRITNTERQRDGTLKISNGKKKNKRTKEYGVRFNVWEYHTGMGQNKYCKNHSHPAMFPLDLVKDHILSWSNTNDIIFDPMMGGGTTGIACKLLNRSFIGVEKVKKYYDFAVENINKLSLQEKLL